MLVSPSAGAEPHNKFVQQSSLITSDVDRCSFFIFIFLVVYVYSFSFLVYVFHSYLALSGPMSVVICGSYFIHEEQLRAVVAAAGKGSRSPLFITIRAKSVHHVRMPRLFIINKKGARPASDVMYVT